MNLIDQMLEAKRKALKELGVERRMVRVKVGSRKWDDFRMQLKPSVVALSHAKGVSVYGVPVEVVYDDPDFFEIEYEPAQ